MTLLNRASNGHVASMVAIWRTLRSLGPMRKERLLELAGHDAPENKVSMTLSTWKNLGLFEDEEKVRVAPRFSRIALDDLESLRTAVFGLLMELENCPALLDVDEEELDRASDFVRVAAWCLAQDPYAMASWKEDETDKLAQAQGIKALWRGTGRWPAFKDWAYFCGVGIPTVHGFVLNPAHAIRVALGAENVQARLKLDADLPLPDFIRLLSQEIPVLEEGAHRRTIETSTSRGAAFTQERKVSACTTLALLQLEHEGSIVLFDRPGDVAARFTLIGRAGRALRGCSHVRRGVPRHDTAVTGSQP